MTAWLLSTNRYVPLRKENTPPVSRAFQSVLFPAAGQTSFPGLLSRAAHLTITHGPPPPYTPRNTSCPVYHRQPGCQPVATRTSPGRPTGLQAEVTTSYSFNGTLVTWTAHQPECPYNHLPGTEKTGDIVSERHGGRPGPIARVSTTWSPITAENTAAAPGVASLVSTVSVCTYTSHSPARAVYYPHSTD
jgi:hypothetical protein